MSINPVISNFGNKFFRFPLDHPLYDKLQPLPSVMGSAFSAVALQHFHHLLKENQNELFAFIKLVIVCCCMTMFILRCKIDGVIEARSNRLTLAFADLYFMYSLSFCCIIVTDELDASLYNNMNFSG